MLSLTRLIVIGDLSVTGVDYGVGLRRVGISITAARALIDFGGSARWRIIAVVGTVTAASGVGSSPLTLLTTGRLKSFSILTAIATTWLGWSGRIIAAGTRIRILGLAGANRFFGATSTN